MRNLLWSWLGVVTPRWRIGFSLALITWREVAKPPKLYGVELGSYCLEELTLGKRLLFWEELTS
jgi:hypothetical protein